MWRYVLSIVAILAEFSHGRQCYNVTVPVTIKAQNAVLNIQAPITNIDVTNFILDLTQAVSPPYTQRITTGNKTVGGTYSIAGTLCNPDKGQSKAVQLLTHGVGFDRFYWDASFNNYNYSYTAVAVDKYGYSTFSWDRLGIGMSSHGEPVNEIQGALEVEALHVLTQMLRTGGIPGTKSPFSKVVHVGHSFGSLQSYALTSKYARDSDGIALTGFAQNGSFIGLFAQGGNFVQANTIPTLDTYANGYIAAGDSSAVHNNFFAPGNFDPSMLTFATKTGQPASVGELLTSGSLSMNTNKYDGPVLVITGDRDVPFCGGNCMSPNQGYPSIPAAVAKSFPSAKTFKAVVVPKSGHGLNYEYSHPFTYKSINDFFVQYVV